MSNHTTVQTTEAASLPAVESGRGPGAVLHPLRQTWVAGVAVAILVSLALLVRWLGLAEMIQWLGKFHPPIVHLPVAMLPAAAVAEGLLVVTGRPHFQAVTRYCVWFGAVAAMAAAVTGWFFGGLRLIDDDWILTTHRWLGTFSAACCVIVLILGERIHRTGRSQARICFRVALLCAVAVIGTTGFFGGSLIYGLDHYAW